MSTETGIRKTTDIEKSFVYIDKYWLNVAIYVELRVNKQIIRNIKYFWKQNWIKYFNLNKMKYVVCYRSSENTNIRWEILAKHFNFNRTAGITIARACGVHAQGPELWIPQRLFYVLFKTYILKQINKKYVNFQNLSFCVNTG